MDGATAHAGWDEARGRRVLLIGLAVLWLIDGLLQLQPAMFTSYLTNDVWAGAAQGPAWLAALVTRSISFASPWHQGFNLLLAGTQLALGASLLLAARPRARLAALGASLLFALAVWVLGEGMGGLLAPGASLLVGAPGSALLYAAASALLLLPPGGWGRMRRRWGVTPVQAAAALLLFTGAVWELAPPWWSPLGLSGVPAGGFMMPQPHLLRAAVGAASGIAFRAPVLVNAALVAAMALAGVGLAVAGERRAVLAGVLALVALFWVCGQDAGMVFSASTDPNTMPPLALLVWAQWAAAARPAPAPAASAGGGARQAGAA